MMGWIVKMLMASSETSEVFDNSLDQNSKALNDFPKLIFFSDEVSNDNLRTHSVDDSEANTTKLVVGN
jgi:hypothetical protein